MFVNIPRSGNYLVDMMDDLDVPDREPDLHYVCSFCDEGDIYTLEGLVKAWKHAGYDKFSVFSDARRIMNLKPTTCPVCLGTGTEE